MHRHSFRRAMERWSLLAYLFGLDARHSFAYAAEGQQGGGDTDTGGAGTSFRMLLEQLHKGEKENYDYGGKDRREGGDGLNVGILRSFATTEYSKSLENERAEELEMDVMEIEMKGVRGFEIEDGILANSEGRAVGGERIPEHDMESFGGTFIVTEIGMDTIRGGEGYKYKAGLKGRKHDSSGTLELVNHDLAFVARHNHDMEEKPKVEGHQEISPILKHPITNNYLVESNSIHAEVEMETDEDTTNGSGVPSSALPKSPSVSVQPSSRSETSEMQQQLLSIVPHITGFASILGSTTIIVDVVRKYRKTGNSSSKPTTYHRLMLGMSFCNIFFSGAAMMSTWPIPANTPDTYATHGNDASCKAQAFFIQLGVGTPFYTLCLTIYYYLFIVKNSMPSLHIESFMHFICILFPLGTAIAALALDLFGYAGFWCWISSENYWYQMGFWYIPLWIIIVSIAVIMFFIYFSIAKQEARQRKFRFQGGLNNQDENRNNGNNPLRGNRNSVRVSDSVRGQAFWYVGSFFLVWSLITVIRVMKAAGREDSIPFWVKLGGITLAPSQGLFNFWIYVRPRFKQYRKRHPEVGRFKAFFWVNPIFVGCKCCHGSPAWASQMSFRKLYTTNFLQNIRNARGARAQNNGANEDELINDYNSQEEEESESEQNTEGEGIMEHPPAH